MVNEKIDALRAKLKPVSLETIKVENSKVEGTLRKGRFDKSFVDNIKIQEGVNLFRIFPSHPNEDGVTVDNYTQPCVVCYVPAMVPERDAEKAVIKNADGSVKMKLSRRAVFSSAIHGKKDERGNPLCKDMIDEYRKMAFAKFSQLSKSENDVFMRKINGAFGRNGAQGEDGLKYSQTDVMYVKNLMTGEFGRYEAKKSVKKAMDSIAEIESSGEPLGTDPFTDPEEGRPVIIFYNPSAKEASDYYKTSLDTTQEVRVLEGKNVKVLKQYPLSNSDLEVFIAAPSLKSIYQNAFTFEDYKRQLFGVQTFDERNKFGIFDTPEFQEICQKVHSIYFEEPKKIEEEYIPEGGDEMDGGVSVKVDSDEEEEEEILVISKRSKLSSLQG